jgi:hypothetical protein
MQKLKSDQPGLPEGGLVLRQHWRKSGQAKTIIGSAGLTIVFPSGPADHQHQGTHSLRVCLGLVLDGATATGVWALGPLWGMQEA